MLIEFGGNEVNQAKADPDSDRGNNLTMSGLWVDISQDCPRYRLMCSTIGMLSLLVSFVKFVTLY
jgi:hypothetical protein